MLKSLQLFYDRIDRENQGLTFTMCLMRLLHGCALRTRRNHFRMTELTQVCNKGSWTRTMLSLLSKPQQINQQTN
jgi:hypothetical protein